MDLLNDQSRTRSGATPGLALVGGLFILLAGGLAYSNALDGVFLLDDHPQIVDNPAIRQLTPLSKFLFDGGVRKLPMLSLAVNYSVGGLNPLSYHYFNLGVHLLTGLCLYGLFSETFKAASMSAAARANGRWMAIVAAGLWIVHPLNTQAVNYVIQRSESMMGLAFSLFLLLYAKSARSAYPRVLLVLAWFVFCAGLTCKEVMVMGLPVAMLYDRAFLTVSWRESIRARGKLWLACAAPLGLAAIVIAPSVLGGEAAVGLQLTSVSPWEYLTTQPQVILHYLRLAVIPWPQVFDYGWPPEKRWVVVVVTSGVLMALVGYGIWLYRRQPQRAFWGLAPLLILLPTSSLVPLQDLAVEHRMYLPLAFLLVLATMWLYRLGGWVFRDHPVLIATALGVLGMAGMTTLTMTRNRDYASAIRMWQDVINKTVGAGKENMLAGRAYTNLGQAWGDAQDWEKSIAALTKAMEYGQFSSKLHGNLTRAFVATRQLEAAKLHCQKALELEPDSARLRQQAGLIEVMEGNYQAAEKSFQSALELDATDTVVLVNLARCKLQLRQPEEANALLRQAIAMDRKAVEPRRQLVELLTRTSQLEEALTEALNYRTHFPQDPHANLQLGVILAAQGEPTQAIEQLQIAANFEPPVAEANLTLGNICRAQNAPSQAQAYYEVELKHFPNNADALNRLAELVAKENPQLSIRYFQRVVNLAPGYWQARYNMASLHAMLGQKEPARELLQAVLQINPEFEPAKQLLRSLD